MFKLVVLCAFLAAAVAEPSGFYAPLAYSSLIAPARTTIINQASSVIHPSPVVYSAPWSYGAPLAHLIKKRSAVLTPYIAPTYISHTPIAAPIAAPIATPIASYAATPLAYTSYSPYATTYGAPIYTAAAHFIKKRSAPLLVPHSYSYVAPTVYRAPLLTTTYTAPIFSSPLVSSPISYTHLIKKRSAPLAVAYTAPSAYSHQSRLDIKTSPAVATYQYSSPITYASPFGFTRLY